MYLLTLIQQLQWLLFCLVSKTKSLVYDGKHAKRNTQLNIDGVSNNHKLIWGLL